MKMDLSRHLNSPLDLSEIRAIVATYLDRKDLVICLCVSRDWFKDFVGPVWHTVDLAKDKKFVSLSPHVLDKYGCCIRQVHNILTFDHVKTLQHPKLNSLTLMSVVNHINPYHRALEFDTILRNSATLTELEFRGPPPKPDNVETQQTLNQNYLEASLLISCLPSSSPSGSSTMGSHLTSLYLKHSSSVTHLNASLAAYWTPDSVSNLTAPTLLCHFPMLQVWHVRSVYRPPTWDDVKVRKELSERCPHLTSFMFKHVGKVGDLSDLLLRCIRRPESLAFPVKNMSEKMALSLITHNNTLTSFTITNKCVDPAVMKWVYLIPMSCSRLQVFSAEELVLDMKSVEEHEWSCQDLRELRVRFKDLEDAQLIDACLRVVCSHRKRASRFSTVYSQVYHHLLQFDKLRIVSLGTKVYYLPAASV
ncbi:hypothetical protein KI688_010592 [Linnemannia hyalina]|uniref:F-box domain-containing protein n=1 Tax=Linnemannia hyalina TaxID=64524 RepID=A0A9P7XZ45_9FUNG|nr:hypothetical protein KI688_010592 [Linnemannia hyalina]